jgi:hypothetical protein
MPTFFSSSLFRGLLATAFLALGLAATGPGALAQQTEATSRTTPSPSTEGVGVGVSLIGPTGVTSKLWISDRQAIQAATTFSVGEFQSSWLLQADFLFHNFGSLDIEQGLLALYVGPGFRFRIVSSTGTSNPNDEFAVRVPIGLTYVLDNAPVDLFIEMAPEVVLTAPNEFSFGGAIGFRYYLN